MTEPLNVETSGGTRFSAGKPGGWWYLPLYGLRYIAEVAQAGAKKYAPLDWAEGQSFSVLFDCMSRHFLEVQAKGVWARDPENGKLHLAEMGWNLLCLLTFMALGRTDLDDMTPWRGINTASKHKAEEVAEETGTTVVAVLQEWDRDFVPVDEQDLAVAGVE